MNISFNNFGNTNFKVRRQKFGIGLLIFLILFGAVLTAVGIFAYKSMQIDESWTRTQGEVADVSSRISDGSTTYTSVIKYEINGKSYQVSSSSGSTSPNIGEKREVAYNPARPHQSKVSDASSFKLLVMLFPVIGIAMLILAPFLFIKSKKRSNRIKNLMQTGQKLQGILVDIQMMGVSSDNNNTYKIAVSAADSSGKVQNYTSDSLSGVAGLAMADFQNKPILIDVYVDPGDPQNYYVDISDIPNLTPQRIGDLIKSAVSPAQPNTITGTVQQTAQSVQQTPSVPQPSQPMQPPTTSNPNFPPSVSPPPPSEPTP